jgi:hypothetical protein
MSRLPGESKVQAHSHPVSIANARAAIAIPTNDWPDARA